MFYSFLRKSRGANNNAHAFGVPHFEVFHHYARGCTFNDNLGVYSFYGIFDLQFRQTFSGMTRGIGSAKLHIISI